MRRHSLEIPFPAGGLDRSTAFPSQPFLTTPDALNVRPFSVGEAFGTEVRQRLRGGSRPGLGKAYNTLLGGSFTSIFDPSFTGAPIRMLASLAIPSESGQITWVEEFARNALSSITWNEAMWLTTTVDADSVTRASNIVTVVIPDTLTLVSGQEVVISGADQTAYNGTFKIIDVTPDTPSAGKTTFTYRIGTSPATPATGDIKVRNSAFPRIFPTDLSQLVFNTVSGAVRRPLTDLDKDRPYSVVFSLSPHDDTYKEGKYRIYLRMDDDDPDVTEDGIEVELELNGLAFDGVVRVYQGGVAVTPTEASYFEFDSGSEGSIAARDFMVTVFRDNLRGYWGSNVLFNIDLVNEEQGLDVSLEGKRLGFGIEAVADGGISLGDSISVVYFPEEDLEAVPNIMLLAASGGALYREEGLQFIPVASDIRLSADRLLSATERVGNLYIADYSEILAQGDDGVIASDELTLSAASIEEVAAWTDLGIDKNSDVVMLMPAGAPIQDFKYVTYEIEDVFPDRLVLKEEVGASGTTRFRVLRGPKRYIARSNRLEIWLAAEDKGEVPSGCPLIATFRDRLVVGGPPYAPHAWFMSRQGDPDDWDYSQTDAQAAIAGVSSDAGVVGQPLTALIPFSDDYMVFACASELWVLRGDPAAGGTMENVSRTIGVAGQKAWCHTPEGGLVFFSFDGLYYLPPGAQNMPQSLSRERLPKDMSIPDIDREAYDILLEFDTRGRGVHIHIVNMKATVEDNASSHWWFDWSTKSFWPVSLQEDHEPTSIIAVTNRWSSDSPVLLGSRDGYIRAYRDAFLNDDGDPFETRITFGPIHMGQGRHELILNEIECWLGRHSIPIDWALRRGTSWEEAFDAAPVATGRFSRASNFTARPRVRGLSLYLTLSATVSSGHWALEKLMGIGLETARQRLL